MSNITKYAPAKINLGLEILRKRPDGYHDINTVFYRIDLCDTLHFDLSDELTLECSPSMDFPQQDNIIIKAAKLLREFSGNNSLGAKILLEKRVPMGAGLGGGSSNAATALLALNELWELDLPHEVLYEIAIKLGSDVPFFLKDGSAAGKGRGEKLEYFDLYLPYRIFVVNPGIHVSTKWAYNNLNFIEKSTPTDFRNAIKESLANPQMFRNLVFNDFESIVFDKYPEIAQLKKDLYSLGASFVLMSGSGSTVFALFKDVLEAQNAAEHFNKFFTHISQLTE